MIFVQPSRGGQLGLECREDNTDAPVLERIWLIALGALALRFRTLKPPVAAEAELEMERQDWLALDADAVRLALNSMRRKTPRAGPGDEDIAEDVVERLAFRKAGVAVHVGLEVRTAPSSVGHHERHVSVQLDGYTEDCEERLVG